MKTNQKGFTVIELLIGIVGIFTLVGIIGIGYVAFHFLSKVW